MLEIKERVVGVSPYDSSKKITQWFWSVNCETHVMYSKKGFNTREEAANDISHNCANSLWLPRVKSFLPSS